MAFKVPTLNWTLSDVFTLFTIEKMHLVMVLVRGRDSTDSTILNTLLYRTLFLRRNYIGLTRIESRSEVFGGYSLKLT